MYTYKGALRRLVIRRLRGVLRRPLTPHFLNSLPTEDGDINYKALLHDVIGCITPEAAAQAYVMVAVMYEANPTLFHSTKRSKPSSGSKAAKTTRLKRSHPSTSR